MTDNLYGRKHVKHFTQILNPAGSDQTYNVTYEKSAQSRVTDKSYARLNTQ